MKIENGKFVKLASLNIEDCFEYNDYFYTVVDEGDVSVTHAIGSPRVLALCLNNNKLYQLFPDELVKEKKLRVVSE